MKNTFVYKSLRSIYWIGRIIVYRTKIGVAKRLIRQKPKLMYIFGGRVEGWLELARDLYNKDNDFATDIRECNDLLLQYGGVEILSYFEQPINENYFVDELKYSCITAIHIATVKLYHKNGINPNAVVGVSLGELGAGFASGLLTQEEALKMAVSYMSLYEKHSSEYAFFYLDLGYEQALQFCEDCPVWAEIVYEDNPGAVLITSNIKDVDKLHAFIDEKGLPFKQLNDKLYPPYHTSLARAHQVIKDFAKDIEPKPLKCDYYSMTVGRLIHKNTVVDAEYWYEVACSPVLFGSALREVINDGYNVFLQVGPPAMSGRQLTMATNGSTVTLFKTFQEGTDEVAHINETIKSLKKFKFDYSLLTETDENILFEHYKQNANLLRTSTNGAYEYLRKKGPLHYLHQHRSWLLLTYDNVEHILKRQEIFSSSFHKEYDPILLGAEPEQHRKIRMLLQPFFSPAVITEVGKYTSVTAEELLKDLLQRESFDFVGDFSDPITLLALCNFFGMSSDDAYNMIKYTGKDYNDMSYWQKLAEYFSNEFMQCKLSREDSLWGKLREMVKDDQFPFADAVSILKIIWTGGMATTSALISAAMMNLLADENVAAQLKSDDKLIIKFVDECLRLHTSVSVISRLTTQEVEVAGKVLPPNSTIALHLRSAMTDPADFVEPNKIILNRQAKRHLAFGTGIHQCIGMGVAREEANAVLKVALKHLPELRTFKMGIPQHRHDWALQGFTSLSFKKIKN